MNNLHKAIEVLKKGGIVIFPTDTAYGIGCRIDCEGAVKRLFEIRKRPTSQAVPVLVDSIAMAKKYLVSPISDNVRHLMEKYWPGGLTIVYPCKTEKIPYLVRGGTNKLGVRMPNHKLVLDLIKSVRVPILGPSANFHGFPTPYDCEDLDKKLVKLVDYVIKGECSKKQVSTVVDCSDVPWKILRSGAVKLDKFVQLDQYILYIDTSDNKKITVALEINGKKVQNIKQTDTWTSQILLPMIDDLLKKENINVTQLTQININTGPGSFTGLRVGVAVANALGWLLHIPVNETYGAVDVTYK